MPTIFAAMKNTFLTALICLSTQSALSQSLHPFGPTQVQIDRAFVAAHGFDDNDNVEVVLEGQLPNACYTLTQTEIHKDSTGHHIELIQTAHHTESGICAPGTELPPDLRNPSSYSTDVRLGRLEAGAYEISFGEGKTRHFEVTLAETGSVDNLRYATVNNAFVEPIVSSESATFEIRVTGMLNSSCAVLSEPKVVTEDDVIVVLMAVTQAEDFCLPASRPFYKVFTAPTPKAGRYLLHVRSLGGQSKNTLFSVR